MKKSLLILAAAGAIALAGCAKTEFVSAPGGTIGFRTSVATATKATSTTTATLASFNAYAINHATSAAYFEDVTFTKGDDNTFTSANEYIWPAGSLDFYAYAPAGDSQVVKGTDYKTFTVTPSATASEQVDFIYANTNGKSKDANADGVAINFRHTESQIALKVKNSSASLKFEVAGWKVAYLSKSGTFTYADDNTDAASTQLAKTDWSGLDEAKVENFYRQELSDTVKIAAGAAEAVAIGESFILIPQSQKAAAGYTEATPGSAADGSYIAVKLIIRNAIDNSVIYSDGAATAWAMWPVDFEWEPGKKYTYVVDLSGCGFHETVEGDGDGDTDLDKVYEFAVIKFVDVTVDEFAAQDDIDVTMPAEEEEADPVFTVSAEGKKVLFSPGNLWYGTKEGESEPALHFEANQYATASDWDESHVSLFTWSSTVAAAVGESNDGSNLFCDEDHKVSVNGSEAIYYALSKDEWKYLLDNHSKKWAKVNGVKGYVIAPDGFVGTLADSYADDAALAAAGNLVFLPAAGRREVSDVDSVGDYGYYWSSTADGESCAYRVHFDSYYVFPGNSDSRDAGCSVRLITDASVTPAPTPTTTGTAKATIGGSEVDVNWVQLWADGPKFAEYNVGADSATEVGTTMTFTDATKSGAEYVWGANWRTPSKDQMDELLNAATSAGSTKVSCEYTQVGGTWGFKFTGKETGYTDNSVFFPALDGDNYNGFAHFWSSTPSGDKAYYMNLNYNYGDWESFWSEFTQDGAYLVRPVLVN